jgi:hypothetical protein
MDGKSITDQLGHFLRYLVREHPSSRRNRTVLLRAIRAGAAFGVSEPLREKLMSARSVLATLSE